MKEPSSTPWWQSDLYTKAGLTPPGSVLAGPRGLAYVEIIDSDGRTAPGWGESHFMTNYNKQRFLQSRAVARFTKSNTPHALVMRSTPMLCIDIDGKNGGFESAARLVLPPTLAETSKGGNGFHLFYSVEDTWDGKLGFAGFGDRIGFLPGVDIRGTGCVYHHVQQSWNNRAPVELPQFVLDKLNERSERIATTESTIQEALASDDPTEILMIQDNVTSRLAAPIQSGKRNNTLFAIGSEMKVAQVPMWEKQVYDRAIELGLPDLEAEKLVMNIRAYS